MSSLAPEANGMRTAAAVGKVKDEWDAH